MIKKLQTVILLTSFASISAFAHHPAADIVDEDIYEMIDSMVADTPHADLTFDSMGSDDTTEILISTRSVVELDNLLDDGLIDYVAMLDGDVSVTINFSENNSSVDLNITQAE